MGSRVLANLVMPDRYDEKVFARFQRQVADARVAAGFLQQMYDADVTDQLAQVRQPTLVLHYADDPAVPLAGGRQVAEGIPGARLRVLEGAYHLPPARDAARIAEEIVSWCRRRRCRTASRRQRPERSARHARGMTDTDFRTHPVRGPFNAIFFWLTGGMFDRLLGPHKRRLLADLPDTVVELGSGVGANLRYLAPGSTADRGRAQPGDAPPAPPRGPAARRTCSTCGRCPPSGPTCPTRAPRWSSAAWCSAPC